MVSHSASILFRVSIPWIVQSVATLAPVDTQSKDEQCGGTPHLLTKMVCYVAIECLL